MLDLLFETSWEVCNKVGGIYAVLSTKAKTLQQLYKDKVVFIGPDVWTTDNPSPYFVQTKTTLDAWVNQAKLPEGMSVRTGRWNIPGKPLVVLVKFDGIYEHKNSLYGEMWTRFGVDSLHAYGDYDEACMFAYSSALVIESIVAWKGVDSDKIIAHFDEWTTGMGLLYVKSHCPEIATVFTTHATSIGRSICGNGKPLYDYMAGYNGDQMADELNMQSKHSLEKTAALQADAFTTVSDVTARECEQLITRRPLVTPNAFEPTFVPKGATAVQKRSDARERLVEVARALTGDKDVDDNTVFIATSGRCEYRNKGIDVFLDSVNSLRFCDIKKKVVAFVLVPAWVDQPREDLVQAIKENRETGLENAVITHSLCNPASDAILNRIYQLGINNDANDNVKVIFVPSYLNGNDGVFNMTYYDLLQGFDVTVFPSYYEPWGYTPLESIAFGVPTITTDLAGFGQWVLDEFKESHVGVEVVHRTDSNYGETVNDVVETLESVIAMPEKQRKTLRAGAKKIAKSAEWKHFIKFYQSAYEQALASASLRNNK